MSRKCLLLLSYFFSCGIQANMNLVGFKLFSNPYFVETGTARGLGVEKALKSDCFVHLYSIELDPNMANKAKSKFSKPEVSRVSTTYI